MSALKEISRTKIVATVGPSSADPAIIERLIEAGVDAFRLNFSHGTHDSHGQAIKWIKEVREQLKAPVAILQDLSGPKIRLGTIENGPLNLEPGDTIVLDGTISTSKGKTLPVSYPNFADDVAKGHRLMLADGTLEIEITAVNPPRVTCKVLNSGSLTSRKGINYPEGSFNLPAITDKDRQDLIFGLRHGIDYVALSFVKTARDIEIARDICKSQHRFVPLIAKIEKHEAVKNFFEILQAVDGVMVARGDLGVEVPLEKIPLIQKKIIRLSNAAGKPVITATQMLLSMVDSPRPTRAEATDISNAILDGTDAIMLSEETASGKFPLQAVETMQRIATETEKGFPYYFPLERDKGMAEPDITRAISGNAASLARQLNADVIICPTSSGLTARMISTHRPKPPILAITPSWETYYRLALLWGVAPRFMDFEKHMDALLENAIELAEDDGYLLAGQHYVITAGFPFGSGGATNLIQAGKGK